MSDKPRNVLRSAPLPTKHIAEQMMEDTLDAARDWCGRFSGRMTVNATARLVVAEPKDTDNGQCWSEEIFSLL